MIANSWSIDWISATFKDGISDLDVRTSLSFGFPKGAWTQGTPKFGYTFMMQHPFGHIVMFNADRSDMGVHVSLGGRALRSIADGGHDALSILRWCLREGGKITRLDLAIDVMDVPIDIPALKNSPRIEGNGGTARKGSIIQGDDGGVTAYIGSRKSDKFLRIYDKAIESGNIGRAWTRFELEIKGDNAKVASVEFANLDVGQHDKYIKGVMRAMFNPDHALYQELMNAEAIQIPTVLNTDDNTLEWLLNSVAKTLAKTIIRRSDVDVSRLFLDAVEANFHALQGNVMDI